MNPRFVARIALRFVVAAAILYLIVRYGFRDEDGSVIWVALFVAAVLGAADEAMRWLRVGKRPRTPTR